MTARLRSALLAVALALAGCALPPAEPPMTLSVLDQAPAEVPQHAATKLTLLVFPPEAQPAFDTQQMAYTLRPHHLAYFARNQWAATPAQMLQPLLVRTMERTGAFAAVLQPPHRTTGTLGLRTEIVELEQDFSRQPPVLRLTLRARLDDEATGSVLGTQEIHVQEAMQAATPVAGVEAANAGTANALHQLAAFVLAKMP